MQHDASKGGAGMRLCSAAMDEGADGPPPAADVAVRLPLAEMDGSAMVIIHCVLISVHEIAGGAVDRISNASI